MSPKRKSPTEESSSDPRARVGAAFGSEVRSNKSMDVTPDGARITRIKTTPAAEEESPTPAAGARKQAAPKTRARRVEKAARDNIPKSDAETMKVDFKEKGRAKPTSTRGDREEDGQERENGAPIGAWFVEIHQKLWGRRDLYGQIFRTTTLTTTDFIELQTLLGQANPSRTSRTDVLSIKSNFLRSKSLPLALEDIVLPKSTVDPEENLDDPISPTADHASAHPTISEDIIADATKLSEGIAGIFPCKIQFMDLAILGMVTENLRVPTMMLIRDEWHSESMMNVGAVKGLGGSVVITGQSGIGKTCFLYYNLILRLIQAENTVFQTTNAFLFRLTDQVTRIVGEGTVDVLGNDVLALVDADSDGFSIPHDNLFETSNLRILLTSLPRNRADWKWLDQWCPYTGDTLVMEGWSWNELAVTALFMFKYDLAFRALQDAIAICGDIPSTCFAAAISPAALERAKSVITSAISSSSANIEAAISNVHCDKPVPHPAFEIYPDPEDKSYDCCMVRPVSQWAFDRIVEKMEQEEIQKFLRRY